MSSGSGKEKLGKTVRKSCADGGYPTGLRDDRPSFPSTSTAGAQKTHSLFARLLKFIAWVGVFALAYVFIEVIRHG